MTAEARVGAIAAVAGLAAVGMPAAGLADGMSPPLRVALVLFGGWVVPALLCAPLARRFVTGAGVPALAFFFALSLHAVWSETFRLSGARFSTYADALTWLLLIGYGTVAFTAWMRRREGPSPRAWRPRISRAALVFVLCVGALTAIAAWSRGDFTVEEDAYDHIGYLRRTIDFDDMRPDGVLALPAGARELAPDPRKGALHPAIAWAASLADANPAVVWATLPLVLYPAFVVAFVAFSRVLLAGRGALLVCVALFMLSYGGTAFQLAAAAAYGQNLAAAWFWVLAALVLYGRAEHPSRWRRRTLAVGVMAFCGALVHAGVALHAGLLAASLVVFAPWLGFGYRRAALDALALTAAAALALVLRSGFSMADANVIHSHVQGVLFVGDELFVASPFEILRQFGMVFLGGLVLLPALVWPARRRPDARAVLALCVLPVCIAFIPPLATALFAKGSYMVFRGLLNAPVFAASALVIVGTVDVARRGRWWTRVVLAAVLALWGMGFVRPALVATRADIGQERARMDQATRDLVRHVDRLPGAVVLSDPATAYLLSAYCAHRFVAIYDQHANPRDPFALDRLQTARDVLSPFADASRAVEACRRYGVGYVVVNRRSPAHGFLADWDDGLFATTVARLRGIGRPFQEISTADDVVVFRVWSDLPMEQPPDPLPAPVFADPAAPASCVVMAPEHAFEVTGLVVAPASVSPGDSVTITVGYRRDETTPFGLPFLAHVRFDHESVFQARPYPGDKYVRRFEDRRRGVVTRFRADFRPGAGVYAPDLWPIGVALCERIPFVVPHNALPGSYRVELRMVRESLLPNFHARDLLYNRDHYSGTECASIEVRAGAGESE